MLVYGAGRRAASIARLRRRSDRRGFVIVGYVPAEGDDPVAACRQSSIDPTDDDLLKLCSAQRVDEIVVAMDDRRRQFPMDQLLECRLEGVEIVELVTFLERETGKVRLDILNPSWMIFSEGFRQGRIHGTLERAFDIVASLMLLAVAAPLMLLTHAGDQAHGRAARTIFYRQVRVGQYGRPFKLLKFRSMREDAERDGKAQWAQKNDSRVTRVGSFIRADAHRRAAADPERAARRDELRRPAAGAAGIRRAAERAHSRTIASATRSSRASRAGRSCAIRTAHRSRTRPRSCSTICST